MTSDEAFKMLRSESSTCEETHFRRFSNQGKICRLHTPTITIVSLLLLPILVFSLVYIFATSGQSQVLLHNRAVTEAEGAAVANTSCGPVEGVMEDSVFVFKGIPYALPPLGPRRWQAPQGLSREDGTCWTSTRQAKQFGDMCTQPAGIDAFSSVLGNEDCLFLNVWTTSLQINPNLPVFFWIHGGNLVFGSGNTPSYMPTPELTSSTNAVYVSLNYRLGPMGFLTLETLNENSTSGTSGNYGLMDIIVALHWVKDNIRNFGGNPDKVTVVGHSSGGTAVHALLASPLASGLFQRAWLASASAILNKTAAQAAQDNRVFLQATGCQDAACLRELSASEVILASPWTEFPYWSLDDLLDLPIKGRFDGALAVVDGYVLKEAPLQAWQNGRGNDVATLITTTAQEADMLPANSSIPSWTWSQYRSTVLERLTPFSEDIARRALQLYSPETAVTPEFLYTSISSDMRGTCPMHVLANVTAHHFRSPVYHAVVTAAPDDPLSFFGTVGRYAFHGWDTLAFFGDWAALGYQPSTSDLDFQQVMRQQVMAFARDGRPLDPQWDSARACTALLSDHVTIVDSYSKERCDFWMDHGFFSYAWIN